MPCLRWKPFSSIMSDTSIYSDAFVHPLGSWGEENVSYLGHGRRCELDRRETTTTWVVFQNTTARCIATQHDTHGGTEPCFSLMVQAVAPKCVMLLVFCMRPWTIPQDSSQCSLPWSSESDGSHGHDASWASCKKFLPNSLTCQRTVSCTTWSNAAMYLCSAVYVSKYVDLDRKTREMLNHTWQPLKVKRSSGHEADRNGILLWANVDNRSKVDHSFYRCLGKTMFVSL